VHSRDSTAERYKTRSDQGEMPGRLTENNVRNSVIAILSHLWHILPELGNFMCVGQWDTGRTGQ